MDNKIKEISEELCENAINTAIQNSMSNEKPEIIPENITNNKNIQTEIVDINNKNIQTEIVDINNKNIQTEIVDINNKNIQTEIVDTNIDTNIDTSIDTSIDTNNTNKIIYTETKCRSCVKALVWRAIATVTTISISYFYLGDIDTATKLGLVDMTIKLGIHYMYERGFTKIKWGYIEKESVSN